MLIIIISFILSSIFYFDGEMVLEVNKKNDLVLKNKDIYKIPFSLELKRFKIEYYKSPELIIIINNNSKKNEFVAKKDLVFRFKDYEIKVIEIYNDFAIKTKGEYINKSNLWNNPAIKIKIYDKIKDKTRQELIFLNYATNLDIPIKLKIINNEIKNFISEIEIEDKNEVKEFILSVNKPIKYKGYKIYQKNYDPNNSNVSIVKIKKDNYVYFVYLGFLILILGVIKWIF